MDEDLDALLVAEEQSAFGRAWQIAQQSAGPWRDLTGTFDRRHIEQQMEEGPPQSARHVTLSIRLSDLPAGAEPKPGHQLRGVTRVGTDMQPTGEYWQVTEVQPDAMGGAVLVLGGRRGQPAP